MGFPRGATATHDALMAALIPSRLLCSFLHRSNDLFKELDKRELTVDEESIIKQRVEHQRRMLEEYEKREESRKVRELVDVCGGNVTEEEAKYALKHYGGREDDAASALVSQGSFLAKVKNVVSGVPLPVAPQRVRTLAPSLPPPYPTSCLNRTLPSVAASLGEEATPPDALSCPLRTAATTEGSPRREEAAAANKALR